jgi:hypothetical protein
VITVDLRSIALVEQRDGFVWFQPQPYGAKGSGVSYEAIPPFGLMGRPRGPTDAGAPNVLVLRDGPEGFTIATTDPRYQDLLPDTGEGGSGLYGTVDVGGTKIPHVAIFGASGDAAEGTVRISCQSSAGETKVDIDPTTGDVTITHAAGTAVVVKASGVELGAASGGLPLALALPIIAWAATVESRLTTLGQGGAVPAGVATTKVNGT